MENQWKSIHFFDHVPMKTYIEKGVFMEFPTCHAWLPAAMQNVFRLRCLLGLAPSELLPGTGGFQWNIEPSKHHSTSTHNYETLKVNIEVQYTTNVHAAPKSLAVDSEPIWHSKELWTWLGMPKNLDRSGPSFGRYVRSTKQWVNTW